MHKTSLAAGAAILGLGTGAVMAESRTYDFASFDQISFSAGIDAVVTKGETQSVRAESRRDGILDKLDISVNGGRLRVDRSGSFFDMILGGGLLEMLMNPENDVTFYITVPELTGIEADSGSSVSVDRVSSDRASVRASSGARIAIDSAETLALQLDANSGASIALKGICDSLDLAYSSGASISARDLDCGDVRVDGSSGASAAVTNNGQVSGGVSSGANLQLYGHPESVRVEASSGGNVSIN